MIASIQYYGMISEKLQKSNEELDLSHAGQGLNLRNHLEERYPVLKSLSYKIAVNQEFKDVVSENDSIEEIALLPPFAGG